jgi:hypothetical protein
VTVEVADGPPQCALGPAGAATALTVSVGQTLTVGIPSTMAGAVVSSTGPELRALGPTTFVAVAPGSTELVVTAAPNSPGPGGLIPVTVR